MAACLSLILLSVSPCVALEYPKQAAPTINVLDKPYQNLDVIERQVYGRNYAEQTLAERVTRLEHSVFGNRQLGSVETRYQVLVQHISGKNTQASINNQDRILDYMEQKLFEQTYAEQTTQARLERLETYVYGSLPPIAIPPLTPEAGLPNPAPAKAEAASIEPKPVPEAAIHLNLPQKRHPKNKIEQPNRIYDAAAKMISQANDLSARPVLSKAAIDARLKTLIYTMPLMTRGIKLRSGTSGETVANTMRLNDDNSTKSRAVNASQNLELDATTNLKQPLNVEPIEKVPSLPPPLPSSAAPVIETPSEYPIKSSEVSSKVPMASIYLATQSNTMAPKRPLLNSAIHSDNYAMSVYRQGPNAFLRWQSLPVRLHLRNASLDKLALIQNALQPWNQTFSFDITATPQTADVILDASAIASHGPMTRPMLQMDGNKTLRTVLLIQAGPLFLKPYSLQQTRRALMHQLGHAAGILGHSQDEEDIMYPMGSLESNDIPALWLRRSKTQEYTALGSGVVIKEEPYPPIEGPAVLSMRDRNTLLKIYGQPAQDLKTFSFSGSP